MNEYHWVSEEKTINQKLEEHGLGRVVKPGGCGNVTRIPGYHFCIPLWTACFHWALVIGG